MPTSTVPIRGRGGDEGREEEGGREGKVYSVVKCYKNVCSMYMFISATSSRWGWCMAS